MKLPQSVAAAALAASLSVMPLPCVFQVNNAQAAEVSFAQDGTESPLIEELKRRTEANEEINAATVKAVTNSNTFTAIEGIAPKAYKNMGGNCVFEKCPPTAKLTPKFDPVDPLKVMRSEFTRVKEGLSDS